MSSDSLAKYWEWYDEASVDAPVEPFQTVWSGLLQDTAVKDAEVLAAFVRTIPKTVKSTSARARYSRATVTNIVRSRPALLVSLWNEAVQRTVASWSVPDVHVLFTILMCELYVVDEKGEYRKESALCTALERCTGTTRSSEAYSAFLRVLKNKSTSWDAFERAALSTFPLAPKSRAIHAMCTVTCENGMAPGKLVVAYVDAVFTSKGSLEEDAKKTTEAFKPILKALSTEDVATLLSGPVGRALRLTTEKSLPASLLLCDALNCNVIPDDCMLTPALKALRTSSKENVQDLAARLVSASIQRASEASGGGVLKELCDELPKEGSLHRRSKMILALSKAIPRASHSWSKMVVATLLRRARDEKTEELKSASLNACVSWVTNLLGQSLDTESETILASKTCYSVAGLRVIREIAAEMTLTPAIRETLIKDISALVTASDADFRIRLYGSGALLALGIKTQAEKLNLNSLNLADEQDSNAAVGILSKFNATDDALPQGYYVYLGLLLSSKHASVRHGAKRVSEARVVTNGKEKDMMRAIASDAAVGYAPDKYLTLFAIQAMLPRSDLCDPEHFGLVIVLAFKCAPKLRRRTLEALCRSHFASESSRAGSLRFYLDGALSGEGRLLDPFALSEALKHDPSNALLEKIFAERLNPEPIRSVSDEERLAAFSAPPGRLSDFVIRRLQEQLGHDSDDDTEEGRARALRQGRRGRTREHRALYGAETEEWERRVRAEQKEKAKQTQGAVLVREVPLQEVEALRREEELRSNILDKTRVYENAADALIVIALSNPEIARSLADKVLPAVLSLVKSPLVGIKSNLVIDAFLSLVFASEPRLTTEMKGQLRKRERADPRVLIDLNDVCSESMAPLTPDLFEFVFPVISKFTESCERKDDDDDEQEEEDLNDVTDAMFNLLTMHNALITRAKRETLLPGLLRVVAQTPVPSSLNCIVSMFSSEKPSSAEVNVLVGDVGLLHKEPAVRLVAITALSLAERTAFVVSYLWYAASDVVAKNRAVAEEAIKQEALDPKFHEVLSQLLSNKQDRVRKQTARALASGLLQLPKEASVLISKLLQMFRLVVEELRTAMTSEKPQARFFDRSAQTRVKEVEIDQKWYQRSGIAFSLAAFAGSAAAGDAIDSAEGTDDEAPLPVINPALNSDDALKAIDFILSDGTRDSHPTVRAQMISAGSALLQAYGKELGEKLIALVQSYLEGKKTQTTLSEAELDLQREGAVVLLGAAAASLSTDDERVPGIAAKLVAALETPSESVQRASCRILPQLMKNAKFKAENGGDSGRQLVELCLDKALSASSSFGSRKGYAMGLASLVKGLGISTLKTFSVVPRLIEASASDKWETRQGSLFCFDELTESLGRIFEPYLVQIIEPVLLKSFSDTQLDVRDAAHDASKKVMANMSGPGVSMLLPKLLSSIASTEWRTKQAAILMLGSVAFCAPKQLASALPQVVPKLIDAFTDTHPKVRASALSALKDVQSVVRNPEIEKISLSLIAALTDPHERTKDAVDVLFQTRFVHTVDAPSLALLVPILRRGLKERATETKKRAALIVGNMISMISDAKAVKPYLEDLMPVLKTVLVDPIPGVRGTAAKALGTLVRGLGPEGIPEFPALFQFLIDTMQKGMSSVERQGGAQGFVEILVALDDEDALDSGLRKEVFERASDSSIDPNIREGALWALVFLPSAMENVSHYALDALITSLEALADDTESVRDAALRCSRVYVAQFTTSDPQIILSALETGLIHVNWRVRQTSVRLLADFLTALQKAHWTGPQFVRTSLNAPPPMEANDDDEEGEENEEEDDDDEEEEEEETNRAKANANVVSDGPIDSVLLKLFGAERRDLLIATVYLMRSDNSSQVRQNALFVWKTMVYNTPRTIRRVIRPLMTLIVQQLSSPDLDRQRSGGRALADVVKKLGDRVLPEIVPVVLRGLDNAENEQERVGVAMGLAELVGATTKSHLEPQAEKVLEAVLKGLCDENSKVRELSGKTFNRVHVLLGATPDGPATTYVLTRLCDGLSSDEERCTRGLTQAVEARSRDCLTMLLPRLLNKPLDAVRLRALASCMKVVPQHLHHYLRQIIRTIVTEIAVLNLGPPHDNDSDIWRACVDAFSGSVYEEQAISSLLVEITDITGTSTIAGERRVAISLLQAYLSNTDGLLANELGAAVAIKCTVRMFAEQDSDALTQAGAAFAALIKHAGASGLTDHIDFLRNSIRTVASTDKHRPGAEKRAEYELPAFGLKPCVDALLEVLQYALMNGSNEERESAAEGLGEFVDLVSADTLRPYVVKITGPLIRIVGDRFPAQVKVAILETLRKLLSKGGAVLRPFLPQLQTTFVKALQNTTETVRVSGSRALQVLVPLSPRVDPLCSELVQGCTSTDADTRQHMIKALFFVLSSRLSDVSLAALTKILERGSPVDSCTSDWRDVATRVVAAAVEAKALESVLRMPESDEVQAIKESVARRLVSRLATCEDETKDASIRHGALLSLNALLRIRGGAKFAGANGVNPMIALEAAARDMASDVRSTACDAAGWALLCKSDFPNAEAFATLLRQAAKSDADGTVRSVAEFSLRRTPDMFDNALESMEKELA